ncbi:MAG: hypothetical protein AB1813_21915 [Verrucomicrobiota bacterium]
MQHLSRGLASLFLATLCTLVSLSQFNPVQAQEKKADPTGTWTWTTPGRGGNPDRKTTLKLKLDGEKLTGTLATPRRDGQTRDLEIEKASLKGDEVSFTVTRQGNNNNTISQKYTGKISGDSIKGKMEFERNGETQSRDWEAKRETEKKQ